MEKIIQGYRLLPGLLVAVFLLAGAVTVVGGHIFLQGLFPAVQAAEAGHSGGHSGGHDSGDDHDSGHTSGQKGKGGQGTHRGGHSKDVGRGGGKAVEDKIFRGQRPVWAQEGIPEVELGRLNVSRAPGHVLARAENEALATYSAGMAALYTLPVEQAAELLQTNFREVERYDSPLQNLALYKDVMTFGETRLPDLQPTSQLDLAAIFLGSAADKTIPITTDTVTAVNRILGLMELGTEERSTLATKADQVRAAILSGHGDIDH